MTMFNLKSFPKATGVMGVVRSLDKWPVAIACAALVISLSQVSCNYQKRVNNDMQRPTTPDSRLQYTTLAANSIRKQLFQAVCNGSSETSDTGAWCLFPKDGDTNSYGYAMAQNHVTADKGIARTVASLIKPGQQLLDLGCGIGQYGQFFRQINATFAWTGYDGAVNVEEYTHGFVNWADLTVPGFSPIGAKRDWVMALEIGEHVPSKFEDIVIENIDKNNLCGAIVSWAVPGQGGHSHVNERPNDWVMDQFTRLGYVYDEAASNQGRESAQYGWFKGTFMVFKRMPPGPSC